ncbi:hypothetical protein H4S14_000286 [Agrobacterium vitis]|nr:hypothetical protein [Agrobacterium vitis]MBE1436559.1 hypothetical protein [Agrobacterium vitis]
MQKNHPVFGVEIIGQNRILQGWRDFTATELNAGPQRIYFDVPPHMASESGVDAPFEFRFQSFGICAFKIEKLVLTKVSISDAGAPSPMVWRLLGRLKRFPLSARAVISPLSAGIVKFGRPMTPIYLPAGIFNLEMGFDFKAPKRERQNALEIRLMTQNGQEVACGIFSRDDLLPGHVSFLFEMPTELSYEAGAPHRLHVVIRQSGGVKLSIDKLDIRRVDRTDHVLTPKIASPSRPILGSKKTILIFGNCQGSVLANVMRHQPAFTRQFNVQYHTLTLPANLHEQGRRDLERCDILLVQDIREWEQYPLKEYVPDTLTTIRYPCIRFASPWPFDAFNGPDDRLARDKDHPNFEFTYFDGLLARLRREIPDHEERFEAYRHLNVTGVIDPKRLHAFEEKRLRDMDQKFSMQIGAFILENFRRQSVFYTTAHPNGTIFRMLLKYIAGELGVRQWIWPSSKLDALKNLQIPVHPLVARTLDLKWANDTTQYRIRGEKVTWENYVRRYISYYG